MSSLLCADSANHELVSGRHLRSHAVLVLLAPWPAFIGAKRSSGDKQLMESTSAIVGSSTLLAKIPFCSYIEMRTMRSRD